MTRRNHEGTKKSEEYEYTFFTKRVSWSSSFFVASRFRGEGA
jgi:hypothetical protein